MARAVFETNVFAVIALTNAMLPLLLRSPAPRIVNVSSAAGSLTIASDPDGPLAGPPTPASSTRTINDHTGHLTTAQGAAVVVRLATLDTDGPTGGFFNEGGPLPW